MMDHAERPRVDWVPPPSKEYIAKQAAQVVHLNGKGGEDQQKDDRPPLIPEPLLWRDPATIPPRQWMLDRLLLRQYFTQLAGTGGAGKTTLAIAMALSLVTRRDLLGFRVYEPAPVWIITLEDDRPEMERRIFAACMYYGIDYQKEIAGRLYVNAGRDRDLILAQPGGSDTEVTLVDVAAIEAQVRAAGLGLVVIDPFVKSHRLNENSNVLMDQVATALNGICYRTGCAALLAHHTRKGGGHSVDDIRGAGAVTFGARVNLMLSSATEEDANNLGIPLDDAWRHVRLDDVKVNLAPRGKARWFKLDNQHLGNVNVDPLRPHGDEIQIIDRWYPPKPLDGLDLPKIAAIFDRIRQGPGEGERYSPEASANAWVGNVLVEIGGLEEKQAKAALKSWMRSGVLLKGDYISPRKRKSAKCVALNEAAAAAILAGIGVAKPPDLS